jgi:tight adherence protein B
VTKRLLAVLAVSIAVLLALPAAWVGAQTAPAGGSAADFGIREIDATNPDAVKVTFFYQGNRNDLGGLTVRVNDRQVPSESAKPLGDDRNLGVVLLIDTSKSMETNAAIERAKEGAIAFVKNKSPQDSVAIVHFDSDVQVAQEFTTDPAKLEAAITALGLKPQTALYDGVVRAAGLFSDTTLQKNIVLLSDGGDTASTADESKAIGALTDSGAVLFSIGINGADFNLATISSLAKASGGSVRVVTTPSDLEKIYGDVLTSLKRQYTVTFPTGKVNPGPVDVKLTVLSQQASGQFSVGSKSEGAAQIAPQAIAKPSGWSFLRSNTGLGVAVALVLLAVAGLVYSLAETFTRERGGLTSMLQPYSEGYVAVDDDEDRDDHDHGLVQTQFLQRAVDFTSQMAERQGLVTKVEGMLERANLPLRAAEALFFYLAVVVVSFLLVTVATSSLIFGIIIGAIAALLPPAVLNFLASRRKKQFLALLPDTLQLLSGTLRAGYSLMQGVEAVAQEVSEPMGKELRRVVTEARLGRPLEVSLDAVAARMDSPDFAWAVMAIRIQREVGGNLSELLLTVAQTMTERERLRRDVAALTAEGKISAIVLGILPVGLGLAMYVINREYITVLFTETIGQIMFGGGLLLALVGFYWMKKMIEIEI